MRGVGGGCHHCVFQWSARSSVYRLRTTIMRTADEVEENATHSTMEQPARSSCLKREEGEGLTAVFAVGERGGGERERERDTQTDTDRVYIYIYVCVCVCSEGGVGGLGALQYHSVRHHYI